MIIRRPLASRLGVTNRKLRIKDRSKINDVLRNSFEIDLNSLFLISQSAKADGGAVKRLKYIGIEGLSRIRCLRT